MLNILIVEDDKSQLNSLDLTINRHFEDVRTFCSLTIQSARETSAKYRIDIFILDIYLPDGIGVEFAKEIRAKKNYENAWIIFTTAFRSYINELLDTRFIDYILKPYSPDRIIDTIRYIINHTVKELAPKKLHFKVGRIEYIINFSDIIYIESIEKKLHIITKNGRHITNRASLNSLQNELPKHIFVQCYRSIFVNTDYISRIHTDNNSTHIHLINNDIQLPVGRRYKVDLVNNINNKHKRG